MRQFYAIFYAILGIANPHPHCCDMAGVLLSFSVMYAKKERKQKISIETKKWLKFSSRCDMIQVVYNHII